MDYPGSKRPPPPDRAVYGPFLQFIEYNPQAQSWEGSVLVVSSYQPPPSLTLQDNGPPQNLQPLWLDGYNGFQFWRFALSFRLERHERAIRYNIGWPAPPLDQMAFTFWLPAAGATWRWGFHSCNGFSQGIDQSKWGGVAPLWRDVMRAHEQRHLHAMVGGGDQVYTDGFFKEPELVRWLDVPDRKLRQAAPMTPEIEAVVSKHFFNLYTSHFSQPGFSEALACLPQVMIWDDHDIFDGWGSYPERLQLCPMFKGLFSVARRFYLLFQHHTTLPRAQELSHLFGARSESYSFVKLLGPQVAIVAPDTRSERSKKTIVSAESWNMIFDRMNHLPPSVQHVVLLTTVPVLYPKIPMSESAMGAISMVGRVNVIDKRLEQLGLWSKLGIMSAFKEPEILDDLVDHWGAGIHAREQKMLVETLQAMAAARRVRVTFLSGDVHAAGVAQFYSHPKVADLRSDHRYMPQIISSAIVNSPPPEAIIKTLHLVDKASAGDINKDTRSKFVRTFKAEFPKYEKILPRRNWAEVCMSPPGGSAALATTSADELVFTFRIEATPGAGESSIRAIPVPIPTLSGGGSLTSAMGGMRISDANPGPNAASPPGPFAWKPSLSNLTNTLKPLASFGRTNSGGNAGTPTAYTGVPANPSNYHGPDDVGYPKYAPGEQPASGNQSSYPDAAGQQYSTALPSGQQHPISSNPVASGSGPYPNPNGAAPSGSAYPGAGGSGGNAYPSGAGTGGVSQQPPRASTDCYGSGSYPQTAAPARQGSEQYNSSAGPQQGDRMQYPNAASSSSSISSGQDALARPSAPPFSSQPNQPSRAGPPNAGQQAGAGSSYPNPAHQTTGSFPAHPSASTASGSAYPHPVQQQSGSGSYPNTSSSSADNQYPSAQSSAGNQYPSAQPSAGNQYPSAQASVGDQHPNASASAGGSQYFHALSSAGSQYPNASASVGGTQYPNAPSSAGSQYPNSAQQGQGAAYLSSNPSAQQQQQQQQPQGGSEYPQQYADSGRPSQQPPGSYPNSSSYSPINSSGSGNPFGDAGRPAAASSYPGSSGAYPPQGQGAYPNLDGSQQYPGMGQSYPGQNASSAYPPQGGSGGAWPPPPSWQQPQGGSGYYPNM